MKGKKTRGKARTLVMLGTFSAILLVVLGGIAMAANPENVTVTAPVAPTIRLSVSKNAVNFGGGNLNPETGSYSDSLTASVSSNILWRLQVEKNRDLTGTDVANVIPSSQLTFGSSSGDARVTATQPAGTEFGGAATMVAEGNRGGAMGLTINYGLDIEWEDAPDTYTATHTYTVVSQ
jgi:hypothetical protein